MIFKKGQNHCTLLNGPSGVRTGLVSNPVDETKGVAKNLDDYVIVYAQPPCRMSEVRHNKLSTASQSGEVIS